MLQGRPCSCGTLRSAIEYGLPLPLLRICSDEESEIKSTDAAEVRERKESNARTRTAMASLRARMEQAAVNKVRE